jgi:hypothetical protein
MSKPFRLALILSAVGAFATAAVSGENLNLFDIGLGAAVWFGIGYGIGSWILRGTRSDDDASPRPRTHEQVIAGDRDIVYTFDDDRMTASLEANLRQRSIPWTRDGEELIIDKEHEVVADELIARAKRQANRDSDTSQAPVRHSHFVERDEQNCSAHGKRHCEECVVDAPLDIERLSRSEVAEALRQIKALHDDGLLNDAEYEAKRQRLANQL